MSVEINFRIITKNHAADLEKRFFTKSIPRGVDLATAMPPAWMLKRKLRKRKYNAVM